MKGLIIILVLVVAGVQQSFAGDFSGRWVGKGHMSGPGINFDCSKIEIIMEQSADAIVTRSYDAECGVGGSSWGPISRKIQGSKVLDEDGDQIGTLTKDALETQEPDSSVVYVFNLTMGRTNADGKRTLHSVYGTSNFVGSLVIQGDLTESP